MVVLSVGKGGMLSNGTAYSLPHGSFLGPQSVAFSPDGSYLATGNFNDVAVFTVSSEGVLSGGTSFKPPFKDLIDDPLGLQVAFSPDGSYFAVNSAHQVAIYGVGKGGIQSNSILYTAPLETAPSIAFSPNSLYVGSANYALSTVTVTIFAVKAGELRDAVTYPLPPLSSGSLQPL